MYLVSMCIFVYLYMYIFIYIYISYDFVRLPISSLAVISCEDRFLDPLDLTPPEWLCM